MRKREKERERYTVISRGSLLIRTRPFNFENKNFITVGFDARIHHDFGQPHTVWSSTLSEGWMLSDLWYKRYSFSTQNPLYSFRDYQTWTSKDGRYTAWDLSFILSLCMGPSVNLFIYQSISFVHSAWSDLPFVYSFVETSFQSSSIIQPLT